MKQTIDKKEKKKAKDGKVVTQEKLCPLIPRVNLKL